MREDSRLNCTNNTHLFHFKALSVSEGKWAGSCEVKKHHLILEQRNVPQGISRDMSKENGNTFDQ